MTTQSPLERAARALYMRDTDGRYPFVPTSAAFHWDDLTHESKALYIEEARAVLMTVREPSKAMKNAGSLAPNYLEDQTSLNGAANIYQAMINAALGE